MSYVEVPGAQLYTEVVGNGPLLLCISGGDGSTDIWKAFAEGLKDRFKVVSYNRRGFGRSYLTDAQDYSKRFDTDIDDAARLLQHFSPDELATVIGNSSGGVVALGLLARHSELIRSLISYEPPLLRVLPDFEEIWKAQEDIYATYRAAGPIPAYAKFGKLGHFEASTELVIKTMSGEQGPYAVINMLYWFERELLVYPQVKIDLESELAPVKEKLILFNGELTPKAAPQYRTNIVVADRLGLDVVMVPGEHIGHRTHAKEFGEKVVQVLKSRHSFYNRL